VSNPDELFVPWAQRSTDKRGLGLGLPLTRRTVQATGGEVNVRNLPGKGCIFSIRLLRPAPSKTPEQTNVLESSRADPHPARS
jgi:signal transduction histidine kinase